MENLLSLILNRYQKCWGLTLWKWGQFKLELWICPKGYKIPAHSHDNQDIELLFLYGTALFARRLANKFFFDYVFATFPKHFGQRFTIPAGAEHYFEVSNKTLIFIGIERWKPGVKVTSASIDFQKK